MIITIPKLTISQSEAMSTEKKSPKATHRLVNQTKCRQIQHLSPLNAENVFVIQHSTLNLLVPIPPHVNRGSDPHSHPSATCTCTWTLATWRLHCNYNVQCLGTEPHTCAENRKSCNSFFTAYLSFMYQHTCRWWVCAPYDYDKKWCCATCWPFSSKYTVHVHVHVHVGWPRQTTLAYSVHLWYWTPFLG